MPNISKSTQQLAAQSINTQLVQSIIVSQLHLGNNMSVRLPSAECYASRVEKEQHWLPKLAPLLPLPTPTPLAMGEPGEGYPWKWSVYRWIKGETAAVERISDLS